MKGIFVCGLLQAACVTVLLAAGLLSVQPAVAATPHGCDVAQDEKPENWSKRCSAAVRQAHDSAERIQLRFQRAYVLNEQQAYTLALEDLDAVVAASPDRPLFLHERAYTLVSIGRYQEALRDLDKQVALQPYEPTAYQERALARSHVADWKGALADRDRQLELQPHSKSALVARAEARLWVGRFEDARADLVAAQNLEGSKDDGEFLKRVQGLLDAWTHHSDTPDPAANCLKSPADRDYNNPALIGDCTIAFLTAESPQLRADALGERATTWIVVHQDIYGALNDKQGAVALDPGNADRHADLGFEYIQLAHSWAAKQEFDRSLAIRKTPFALAGRAEADFNLGQKAEALRDAKASLEMEPNEMALWVLGDIAKDRGNNVLAKKCWMGVYRLGSRDDRLMERLRSIGINDPDSEPQ